MNTHAGIGDLELNRPIRAPHAHRDRSAGAGELHRIRQQVPERLLQAVHIREHRQDVLVEVFREGDPFRLNGGPDDVDRGAHDGADVRPFQRERHLAGDDPGHVHHVLDQPELRVGIPLDDAHGMGRGVVEVLRVENARPAEDGVQRRA